MRAKIYSFTNFNDDGLIDVYVDKSMLKVICDCLEEEIANMCDPETYNQMIQLIRDYQTITEKMDEPIGKTE